MDSTKLALTHVIGLSCAVALLVRAARGRRSSATLSSDAELAKARALDTSDSLRAFRESFCFPEEVTAYLCGNSLGLMPKRAAEMVHEELTHWARRGKRGHFTGSSWLSYHARVRDSLAALVGARPLEVVAMNSLSVNLQFMLASMYQPSDARYKIAIESGAFASDRYAVSSHAAMKGYGGPGGAGAVIDLCLRRKGEDTVRTEDVVHWLDTHAGEVALLLFSAQHYSTGQIFDMQAITAAARERGVVVGWDLAHAIGNVPLRLHDWGVDFAVWCSYKYLNAGPGAIGGAFVHERHCSAQVIAAGDAPPRLAGWWGTDERVRFGYARDFVPAAGADGWQVSNPNILSLAALRASLELFDAAGMERLRAKSIALGAYAIEQLDALAVELAYARVPPFTIITPREPRARGSQLSIRFERAADGADMAAEVKRLLSERHGVDVDHVCEHVIRFAPVPLYCSHEDVLGFVRALRSVMMTDLVGPSARPAKSLQ